MTSDSAQRKDSLNIQNLILPDVMYALCGDRVQREVFSPGRGGWRGCCVAVSACCLVAQYLIKVPTLNEACWQAAEGTSTQAIPWARRDLSTQIYYVYIYLSTAEIAPLLLPIHWLRGERHNWRLLKILKSTTAPHTASNLILLSSFSL